MARCISEKHAPCTQTATVILANNEGGLKQPKCEPCAQSVQRKLGKIFHEFFHLLPLKRH